jgi:hypothetical protein
MRWGCVSILLAATGYAQTVLDPSRLPATMREFQPQPNERKIGCEVRPIQPELDFSFRFQSGWVMRMPLKQYSESRHRWYVVTRVVPEGGEPVYLGSTLRLPAAIQKSGAPKGAHAEVSGSYLLGEGRYTVHLRVGDETGRVCRAKWKVEARRGRNDVKVKVALPPATVADLSRGWRPQVARDGGKPFRLTVLMHAAPLTPRRIPRITGRDRVTLMGILSSMLDQMPASSVRLVVFNLDHQVELLRLGETGPDALGQVSRALNELEIGTVDFQTLVNRKGHVDLLADLINKEVAEPLPADAVVFLGPPARFWDKVPDQAVEKPRMAGPDFYYFQYRPPFRRDAIFGDSIASAISRVGGKLKVIRTPGDFAKAIDEVERRAAGSALARAQ